MRAFALVLLLLPAQESRVQELLSRLDDDKIEVRATAAAALIDMGKTALPALRPALAAAGGELKDRLADIIRKIQERERLALLLPPPSLITIDAENLPLREVFEKVSRQTRTAIDYSQIPEDARVTVKLQRVPLWKALDRICKASGKVTAGLESDHVVITTEPYVAIPSRILDSFRVTLEQVQLSTEVTFGLQDRYDNFQATLRLAWEKGARPYRILGHIAELVDEQGNELVSAGDESEPLVLSMLQPDNITQDLVLDARGPGPTASRLGKLRVEIEFEFPLRYAEVKIDLAANRGPASAECPEFAVKMGPLSRQDGMLACALVMTPRGPLEGEIQSDSIVLKDKTGKEHNATVNTASQTNDNETAFQLTFQGVPAEAEPVELIVRIPTEVHRERIDVELKDLPLQ
jgi:hypothetical protein